MSRYPLLSCALILAALFGLPLFASAGTPRRNQPVVRTFFIEGTDFFSTRPNAMTLHLTEFGLNLEKFQTLRAAGKVSPRRFIRISNPLIAPGQGSGRVTLEGREFRLDYAWAGRGHSYTVELLPIDGQPYQPTRRALEEGIIRDENQGALQKQWTQPRAEYLKQTYGVKDNRLRTLRRLLMTQKSEQLERWRRHDSRNGTSRAEGLTAEALTERTVAPLKYKRTITRSRSLPLREIRPEEL